eukprot:g3352.t1
MPKLFANLLLSVFFQLISADTFPKDVSDLQDIIDLVSESNINLRGWRNNSDPCGDVVPCGINDLPECNWEGIACRLKNGRPRLIGIQISGYPPNHQLQGPLPGRLPLVLRSLVLPNNRLKGRLTDPSCLERDYSNCTDLWSRNIQLSQVNLDGNEIEGRIPDWETLGELHTINLANNRLVGPLPSRWRNKFHLTTINLSQNSLTGSLPVQWEELDSLRSLNLSYNELENEIPAAWFSLSKLKELDVSGNCAICGEVNEEPRFALYGDQTNLRKKCSECNRCECHHGTLNFVVTNVLLSLSVLVLALIAWLIRQWCKRNYDTQSLPIQQSDHMAVKPFEPPTIVVSPGDEVFFAKILAEESFTTLSSESSSSKSSLSKSSSSSRDSTEEESSEWQSETDDGSVDSRVLAFMHNSSPVIRMQAYRAKSTGNAGISETIDEITGSGSDTKTEFVNTELRRSKSALDGTPKCSLEANEHNSTVNAGAGPSSSSGVQSNDASTSQVNRKKTKKRFRNFKRRSRRGMIGDFRMSDPQPSIDLPEDFQAVLSSLQPSESKAVQTSGSFTNKK